MLDDILDFTTPGLGFVEDFSKPLLVLAVWDLDVNGTVDLFLFPLLNESLLTGECCEADAGVESFFSCSFSSMYGISAKVMTDWKRLPGSVSWILG